MQNTAKRVDYIMKPYPVPTLSNGWSGNGVPIEKGHKMGIKKMKKSVKRIERMLDQQSRLIDKALSGGEAVKPVMVYQSDVVPQGDMFVFADNFQRSEGIRDESEVIAQAHKCLENAGLGPIQRDDVINQLHNAGLVLRWAEWTKAIAPSEVDDVDDKEWARAKLAELDAACLKAKGDLEQAGSTVLLARPLEPSPSVGKLKVTVKDWVRYDQDKSCLWDSCSESHTDQYGCIGVKKFGKRVVLAEINTNWVDRLVNNYLVMKEACDKAAIALNEFSHRNMDKAKDEGVPLTDEQAAQLDSGSGTEDTTGWLAGDIADAAAERGEALRKHHKRKEQRKIKDEPQA